MKPLAPTTTTTTKQNHDVREELHAEQKRLAKLWDAFKRQEDEYRSLERERDDLWSRVQDLEKAAEAIGDPTQTAARLKHLDRDNDRLRRDVTELGQRLEEYRTLFDQEQKRLAELFKVYQDTEGKLHVAQAQVDKWQRFWDKHAGELEPKVASSASKLTGAKLTPKQLAQRQYAAKMRVIRERAQKAHGGKGPIKNRTAARKLRRKLGLKA